MKNFNRLLKQWDSHYFYFICFDLFLQSSGTILFFTWLIYDSDLWQMTLQRITVHAEAYVWRSSEG